MGLRVDSLADLPANIRARVAGSVMKAQAAKAPKYRNQPCEVKGIKFPSIRERNRYLELMQALREGAIYDLRLQDSFVLQRGYTTPEGRRIRPIIYKADFTYKVRRTEHIPAVSQRDLDCWRALPDGALVIEDAKGMETDKFKLKEKMMLNLGYVIRKV